MCMVSTHTRESSVLSGIIRKALAEAVERDGLRAVARACGVAHPTLHHFLAGNRDLYLKSAELLADYLDLELKKKRPKR